MVLLQCSFTAESMENSVCNFNNLGLVKERLNRLNSISCCQATFKISDKNLL